MTTTAHRRCEFATLPGHDLTIVCQDVTGFTAREAANSYPACSLLASGQALTMQQSGAHQRGFTLGETLTTLAVLGISLSLAIPGLESLARDNARTTAVNQLVATLHMARSEAITRNAPVAVCPSRNLQTCTGNSWESGWIRFVDNNRNQAIDADELILGVSPPVPGFVIRSEVFDRALGYEASGRVIAADSGQRSGEFTFCALGAEESSQVVIVNPVGEPALSARRVNDDTPDCGDT